MEVRGKINFVKDVFLQYNTRKVCKPKFVPKFPAYNPQKLWNFYAFYALYFRKECLLAVYYAESFHLPQYNQLKVFFFSWISQQNQSKIRKYFWLFIRILWGVDTWKKPRLKILCYSPFKYCFVTVQLNASGSFWLRSEK